MYVHMYVYAHTHIYKYISTINLKGVMNLEESEEG